LTPISKELAEYIRKHSKAHIHGTVHKQYVEDTKEVKKIIKKYKEEQKIIRKGVET
jgi:hypothetical protein